MLPALLLIPIASLAETVTTVIVTTIAAKFASDIYDAVSKRSAPPAGSSTLEDES